MNQKSEKAFKTIGEVSKELDIAQHVLRFWEDKFPQISPIKRKNRRYYRQKDVELLIKIKHLLYTQGFTIKGVRKYLLGKSEIDNSIEIQENKSDDVLRDIYNKLINIRDNLK